MTKNKKNKHLLLLVLVIVSALLSFSCAYAASDKPLLEVKYPNIPGLPSLNGNDPDISAYIGYFFGLLVYVGGILALISFVMGAVGLINPNVESHKNAKDRMTGAILGLVLIVASFIIIQTINPVFVTPTVESLTGVDGVFYTNGSQQKPCPRQEPDTSIIPTGFNHIQYTCLEGADTYVPALLIWIYSSKNFDYNNGAVNVVRIECGGTATINGGSFYMAYETPGVYYCLGGCNGNMCSGYMSGANVNSQGAIENPFNGNIKAVRIVSDWENDIYYGVIFHNTAGLENGGMCTLPIMNADTDSVCMSVTGGVSSAVDIFKLNIDPDSSGNGAYFYSKPWGVDTGGKAGFYPPLAGEEEIFDPIFIISSWDMFFDYTNIDVPDKYMDECVTFQDCPGSIKMKGDYLVALYGDTDLYCQTFTADANNLKTEQIIAAGSEDLGDVYIIPTK